MMVPCHMLSINHLHKVTREYVWWRDICTSFNYSECAKTLQLKSKFSLTYIEMIKYKESLENLGLKLGGSKVINLKSFLRQNLTLGLSYSLFWIVWKVFNKLIFYAVKGKIRIFKSKIRHLCKLSLIGKPKNKGKIIPYG